MEPVPLMRATPQPSGVPPPSTSVESLPIAYLNVAPIRISHAEKRASSCGLSTPASPRNADAMPPDCAHDADRSASGRRPDTCAYAPSIAVRTASHAFSRPTRWWLLGGPRAAAQHVSVEVGNDGLRRQAAPIDAEQELGPGIVTARSDRHLIPLARLQQETAELPWDRTRPARTHTARHPVFAPWRARRARPA